TAGLVYMPWSRTPVVPKGRRCSARPGGLATAVLNWTRGPFDIAFASSYWLGHHGTACLSGLNPFTLDALRPAHSLSTLRGLPRDSSTRKTRYSDLSVFPLTRLRPGFPARHSLVSSSGVTHMMRILSPRSKRNQFLEKAPDALDPVRSKGVV